MHRFPSVALVALTVVALPTIAAEEKKTEEEPKLSRSFTAGPYELGVGIVDEEIRVGLTSDYSKEWKGGDDCTTVTAGQAARCSRTSPGLEIDFEGSWKNDDDALNYATLSLRPEWVFHRWSTTPTVVPSYDPACDGMTPAQRLSDQRCRPTQTATKEGSLSFALFPEVTYRYGDYEVKDVQYEANQLIYSAGFTLYYPAMVGGSLTQGEPFKRTFAASPYIDVAYAKVDDIDSENPLPPPDGIKDEFLEIEANVAMYVPWSERIGGFPWIAHVNLVGSRATDGGDWEMARTYEIIVQTGKALKPAATYKSGSDKGFEYDRQIILGVVYSFLGVEAPSK